MMNTLKLRFIINAGVYQKCVCTALLLCSKMLCAAVQFACKISEALDDSDVLINYQPCSVKVFRTCVCSSFYKLKYGRDQRIGRDALVGVFL